MSESAQIELAKVITAFREWGDVVTPDELQVVREAGSGGCATVYQARWAKGVNPRGGRPANGGGGRGVVEPSAYVAFKKLEVPSRDDARARTHTHTHTHSHTLVNSLTPLTRSHLTHPCTVGTERNFIGGAGAYIE